MFKNFHSIKIKVMLIFSQILIIIKLLNKLKLIKTNKKKILLKINNKIVLNYQI